MFFIELCVLKEFKWWGVEKKKKKKKKVVGVGGEVGWWGVVGILEFGIRVCGGGGMAKA